MTGAPRGLPPFLRGKQRCEENGAVSMLALIQFVAGVWLEKRSR